MKTPPDRPTVIKWPHQTPPTEESVRRELDAHGYEVYDLQTIPPWCERSLHTHDYPEIRGAVSGVTTFHFENNPVTIEAGDILFIPAGLPHSLRTHNGNPFTAFKGSVNGVRRVTELADGKGSVEDLSRA